MLQLSNILLSPVSYEYTKCILTTLIYTIQTNKQHSYALVLFTSLLPTVLFILSDDNILLSIYYNNNTTNNNTNTNNIITTSNNKYINTDELVILYVQFLLTGFTLINDTQKSAYFTLIFPILLKILVQKQPLVVIPIVLLIGKALTNLASTMSDTFRLALGQCKDSDKYVLQTVMRYILQQQAQQQQQGGVTHTSNTNNSSSGGGGGGLNIDVNRFKMK